jgi:hypothetical protein
MVKPGDQVEKMARIVPVMCFLVWLIFGCVGVDAGVLAQGGAEEVAQPQE